MTDAQDPFSDDASTCCSAQSDATTKPSGSMESQTSSTPAQPKLQATFDPLRTPISMPKRLLNSTATGANDNNSKNKPQSPEESEEEMASAFVHAACRLHEATAVATAACNHLIFKWSGLSPKEATAAAVAVAFRLPLKAPPIYKRRGFIERANMKMQHDAMVLQTLLTAARVHVAVAGVMAGMALDAREFALAQNAVHALSACQNQNESEKNGSQTAATLAAYTGPVSTWNDTSYIDLSLSNAARYAWCTARIVSNRQVRSQLFDLWQRKIETLKMLSKLKSDVSVVKTVEYASAYNVRNRIHDAVDEAFLAAKEILKLMDTASMLTTDRCSRATRIKKATARVLFHKPHTTDEDDLLHQARRACQQALTAIQTVHESKGNPIVLASLQEE